MVQIANPFKPAKPISLRKLPAEYRLWHLIDLQANGCWNWLGHVGQNGYGQIGVQGKVEGVHRVAYRKAYGDIPPGYHIDHLCSNRKCIRPDHLEAVTQAENNKRAWQRRKKTPFCLRGHNKIIVGVTVKKHCKECKNEQARQKRRSA